MLLAGRAFSFLVSERCRILRKTQPKIEGEGCISSASWSYLPASICCRAEQGKKFKKIKGWRPSVKEFSFLVFFPFPFHSQFAASWILKRTCWHLAVGLTFKEAFQYLYMGTLDKISSFGIKTASFLRDLLEHFYNLNLHLSLYLCFYSLVILPLFFL